MRLRATTLIICAFFVSAISKAVSLGDREGAARDTAQLNALCVAIQPFYWEIGNGSNSFPLVGDTEPSTATYPTASTRLSIASASKWIYASYVAEKVADYYAAYGGQTQGSSGQNTALPLPPAEVSFLTMTSGYHSLEIAACLGNGIDTVRECLTAAHSNSDDPGYNNDYDPGDVGKFYYNGGHFQKHATLADDYTVAVYPPPFVMDLGDEGELGLQADVENVLGGNYTLEYSNLMLAAGVHASATDYANFLRQILNGDLEMRWLLGTHAVCASSDPAVCPTTLYTPLPVGYAWHYSIGHWVEDDPDPTRGDGAFSSAGALGFYPWIWIDPADPASAWYGIVERGLGPTVQQVNDDTIGFESVLCGRAIRTAWLTGEAQ